MDIRFSVETVDDQQEIDDDLLKKVDHAELEDVFTRLAEDPMHSNFLNASIVNHTVAILICVLAHS